MRFTEAEVRFLIGEHYAPGGQREVLRPITDTRKLGCPEPLFFKVLEQRAKKLGKSLAEFRAQMGAAPRCPNCSPQGDLAGQVQGTRLF
jgi:hypothetical protein